MTLLSSLDKIPGTCSNYSRLSYCNFLPSGVSLSTLGLPISVQNSSIKMADQSHHSGHMMAPHSFHPSTGFQDRFISGTNSSPWPSNPSIGSVATFLISQLVPVYDSFSPVPLPPCTTQRVLFSQVGWLLYLELPASICMACHVSPFQILPQDAFFLPLPHWNWFDCGSELIRHSIATKFDLKALQSHNLSCYFRAFQEMGPNFRYLLLQALYSKYACFFTVGKLLWQIDAKELGGC